MARGGACLLNDSLYGESLFHTAHRRTTNSIVYGILSGCQFGIILANKIHHWLYKGDYCPIKKGTYTIDPQSPPAPQPKRLPHPGYTSQIFFEKVNSYNKLLPFADNFGIVWIGQGQDNVEFSFSANCPLSFAEHRG